MIALYWKLLLTVGQIRLNYIKLSARIACRGFLLQGDSFIYLVKFYARPFSAEKRPVYNIKHICQTVLFRGNRFIYVAVRTDCVSRYSNDCTLLETAFNGRANKVELHQAVCTNCVSRYSTFLCYGNCICILRCLRLNFCGLHRL